MKRAIASLFVVGALLAPAVASSQEGDGSAVLPSLPAQSADALWGEATDALEVGDFDAARASFALFATSYPDDPRAGFARGLSAAVATTQSQPTNEVAVTSQVGRVEATIFSTLWGLGTGALLGFELSDVIGREDEGKVPLWTSIGLGGAALGLSLWSTRSSPPTEGQAAMFSSAGFWGYAVGGELVGGTPLGVRCTGNEWGTDCSLEPHRSRLIPLGLSSGALVGSALYARRHTEVSTGDVALVNAGGAWGTTTAAAVALLVDADSEYAPWNFMLVGTTVGLGTAIGLTGPVQVSRSRIGLMNLSGVLGVGLMSAIGATAEVDDPTAYGALILAGEAAGLATGALLTRRRGTRQNASRALDVTAAPMFGRDERGGLTRGLALSGVW